MKSVLTKITMTLALTLLAVPAISHAEGLILANKTSAGAQFFVKQGDIVLDRVPTVPANAAMYLPTEDHFEVVASTIIDGNQYMTAPVPLDISRASNLTVQMVQNKEQGTYSFVLDPQPGSALNKLKVRNTLRTPVRLTLIKDNRRVQSVVVEAGNGLSLSIEKVFKIYAVINGITTDVVTTTNPNSSITAEPSETSQGMEMYNLVVR